MKVRGMMGETKSKPAKSTKISSSKTIATKKSPIKTAASRKSAIKYVPHTELQTMIATNAYYRAERRGFAPGDHMQDWLDAEAEISQKFKVKKSKA